jgi:hypothetical protein
MINVHNGKNHLPFNMTKLVYVNALRKTDLQVVGNGRDRGRFVFVDRVQLEEAIDMAIAWLDARADQHTFARRGAQSLKSMSSRTRSPEAPGAINSAWDDESVKAFLRELGLE